MRAHVLLHTQMNFLSYTLTGGRGGQVQRLPLPLAIFIALLAFASAHEQTKSTNVILQANLTIHVPAMRIAEKC